MQDVYAKGHPLPGLVPLYPARADLSIAFAIGSSLVKVPGTLSAQRYGCGARASASPPPDCWEVLCCLLARMQSPAVYAPQCFHVPGRASGSG